MNEIKRYRIAHNMTREALGKMVGVSAVSIFRYEKGDREPSITKLKQIALVLDVTVDALIGEGDSQCQSVS